MSVIFIKINNSKKSAIKTGNWSDPGAKLYDKLLDASDSRWNANGKNVFPEDAVAKTWNYWPEFLKEAYLIAPVKDIKNSPYGRTPFSRSGCKYPHHIIRNGELLISIPGLKAAYNRACQEGIMKGEVKDHLERHIKELGIEASFHDGKLSWNESALYNEEVNERIEANFNDIYRCILENTGINLFDDISEFEESYLIEHNESALEGDSGLTMTSRIFDETGKTPSSIYKWMIKNIDYDKTIKGWKLRTPMETYKDSKGNCHDQSLFISSLLNSLGIDNGQIFFVECAMSADNPDGNAHTLTWYRINVNNKENYDYYWIETAWENYRGIHGPFNSIFKLKEAVINAYNNDDDINSHNHNYQTLAMGVDSSNYRTGMSLGKYITSWNVKEVQIGSKKIIEESFDWIEKFVNDESFRESTNIFTNGDFDQYKLTDEEFNEIINRDLLDEPITEYGTDTSDDSKKDNYEKREEASKNKSKEEFVPIYGIVKCYSKSKLRNDGTEKDQGELNSVKFHKIIKKLTRGDNYSHALVSFDDSLTSMYSYEDEGFCIDNILEKDSWMGTESIYICVMFVNKSDKEMMRKYVKNLAEHADESRYASANLLKAFVGTPYKIDKRFVCSSFTGYIMSCANPKNLHRDYSRLRPEDITILPRAFYVTNIKDREDFIKHHKDIQSKVKDIYNEYHDEIEDYNNHLPKLMLQDRVDKLKTIDKIFDWIIDRM